MVDESLNSRLREYWLEVQDGNFERMANEYPRLLSKESLLFKTLLMTDPSYRNFHVNACSKAVFFELINNNSIKDDGSFEVDLSKYTFGRIGPVQINKTISDFLSKTQVTKGGNQIYLFNLFSDALSSLGLQPTTDMVPAAYVAGSVVRDVLEYLPFAKSGRAFVDIGAGIGLASLFLRHLGYDKIFLIDIDEEALSAGRQMKKDLELSEFVYLTPDQQDAVTHGDVDQIFSMRSWICKYPFEEYKELFERCLKPGLVVGIDNRSNKKISASDAILSNASSHHILHSDENFTRHVFKY